MTQDNNYVRVRKILKLGNVYYQTIRNIKKFPAQGYHHGNSHIFVYIVSALQFLVEKLDKPISNSYAHGLKVRLLYIAPGAQNFRHGTDMGLGSFVDINILLLNIILFSFFINFGLWRLQYMFTLKKDMQVPDVFSLVVILLIKTSLDM